MAFLARYQINQRLLSTPSARRAGLAMALPVRFLVAHDTGNPGSTAWGNIRYYERTRDTSEAAAHAFVDDREILECIPSLVAAQPEKACHVQRIADKDNQLFGCDANEAAIGVEYCYGGTIDADEAYRKYVWVLAYACDKYGLDPMMHVVGHFFLDPARRTDPVSGLACSRRTYEQLQRDIAVELTACRSASGVLWPASSTTSSPGQAVATVRLNIRVGAPSTRATIARVVGPGTSIAYTGQVRDGEPVNGNPVWYVDATRDHFFWSGGCG